MWRILFALTLAAVTFLAFVPTYEPLPDVVSVSDVLNHFAAFFTLYALHVPAYPAVSIRHRAAGLVFYGLFIETVQAFLPNRSASVGDLLVDAAAVGAAMALQLLWRRRHLTSSKPA
jgi:VanZ family protein